MSISTFIPSVWANELILGFEEQSIIAQVTFPVPTTKSGKYIINKMGEVSVQKYQGQVEYGELDLTSVEVPFDTANYFAFAIKDLDKAQVASDLRAPALEKATAKMAKTVDEDMVARVLASEAHKEVVALSKSNVYDAIVDANLRLNQKDVPATNRVVLCGHDVIAMLLKDADFKASVHRNVMENGMEVFRINGVEILPTNRVAAGTIIVLHKSAVAYGMQIDEVEALRLPDTFADGVRGLHNYGITVVLPEAIEIVAAQ